MTSRWEWLSEMPLYTPHGFLWTRYRRNKCAVQWLLVLASRKLLFLTFYMYICIYIYLYLYCIYIYIKPGSSLYFSGPYLLYLYLASYYRIRKSMCHKRIFYTQIYSIIFVCWRWWMKLLTAFLSDLLFLLDPDSPAWNRYLHVLRNRLWGGIFLPWFLCSAANQTTGWTQI